MTVILHHNDLYHRHHHHHLTLLPVLVVRGELSKNITRHGLPQPTDFLCKSYGKHHLFVWFFVCLFLTYSKLSSEFLSYFWRPLLLWWRPLPYLSYNIIWCQGDEFAKLRAFRALNYMPTCLHVLNYYVPTCPYFSRDYVPTTTHKIYWDSLLYLALLFFSGLFAEAATGGVL